jgi:Leucine-rich repeat (LRR) protein
MSEVEKAILKVIKEKGKAQTLPELLVTDLNIGKITPEVGATIGKCKKIEVLELSSCQLESVENLPVFAKLNTIDLADNKYLMFYP